VTILMQEKQKEQENLAVMYHLRLQQTYERQNKALGIDSLAKHHTH